MTMKWITKEIRAENGRRTSKLIYDRNLKNYLQNPKKCASCKDDIPYEKRKNKFCNHSCAAATTNMERSFSQERKSAISRGLFRHYSNKNGTKYDWKFLQQEYDSGMSLKELTEKHGVCVTTLKAAKKRGLFKTRTPSEAGYLTHAKYGSSFGTSKQISERRKHQLFVEETLAENLRKEGYEVFSPTVVCDRIAIKDGKVYFIEFKPLGQDLRDGQEKICRTTKDNYKIVYYDKEKCRYDVHFDEIVTYDDKNFNT